MKIIDEKSLLAVSEMVTCSLLAHEEDNFDALNAVTKMGYEDFDVMEGFMSVLSLYIIALREAQALVFDRNPELEQGGDFTLAKLHSLILTNCLEFLGAQ